MAQTGGFITPKLWGAPWFEKPPLLYWMVAVGSWAGLGPEESARLPVALLSLAFLVASFVLLAREFGSRSAAIAVGTLATSAGWLAYSDLCLTDVPLAVFFSLAVFLVLPLLRNEPDVRIVNPRFAAAGAALGVATLAKGLVPIALAAPFLWFLRAHWRRWWIGIAACCVIALPWYIAVYVENGYAFIQEFFIRHHLERLYSPALQHVQPWYYYLPVLLLGVFPWTPLLFRWSRQQAFDRRRRFLAAVVVFGLVFFSLSLNKLPGYLLPLLPALMALVGASFEREPLEKKYTPWLLACAVLIALIPLLAPILPPSLAQGRVSMSSLRAPSPTQLFYIAVPILVVWLSRRTWTPYLLVLSIVAGGLYLKATAYRALDEAVSARGLWRAIAHESARLCDGGTNRDWIYGLNFYRGSALPGCTGQAPEVRITSSGHEKPRVTRSTDREDRSTER